jgi:hypothetical protein
MSFIVAAGATVNILISLWAKVACYDDDFNLDLEKLMERPTFARAEILIYLLPRSGERNISF